MEHDQLAVQDQVLLHGRRGFREIREGGGQVGALAGLDPHQQGVNRLHVLVAALVPDRHRGKLSADAATRLLEGCQPTGNANRTRLLPAQDLVDEIAALSQRIALLDQRITQQVGAVRTALTELVGISHLTAAKILGSVVDVHRFATAAAFAAYCGTAPREVSSGDRSRHRLSRAGDRQLNYAIQVMAVTQRRIHPPAQAYANASAWRARAGKEQCDASNAA
ncbi:IS110 family transposase [Streptomyces sp. NPDC001982]|uniref:IS110 family transposase n=1 Tax=Streptomyces sp. NPDC001982 TaxID=3154405 RepID=UPI00332DF213